VYLEALDGGELVFWAAGPEPARQGPSVGRGDVVAHGQWLL